MDKTKINIKRLKEYLKSEKDFENFQNKLIDTMYLQKGISNNSMYDGFIIGLIIFNKRYVSELILIDNHLGSVLEGTSQKLELIFS